MLAMPEVSSSSEDSLDLSQTTIANVINNFPITVFTRSEMEAVIFTYLLCFSILPSVSKQGAEREQDSAIAYVALGSGLIINGLVEFSALRRMQRQPLLSGWDSAKRKEIEKSLYLNFRQIRAAGISVGMTVDYFHVLASITQAPSLGIAATWLAKMPWWGRGLIVLPLTVGMAMLRHKLSVKEVGQLVQEASDISPLLYNFSMLNTREFNNWSRAKLALSIITQSMTLSVAMALVFEILKGFSDKELSTNIKMSIVFSFAGVLALLSIPPDHPHFQDYWQLSKITRFIKNFIQLGSIVTIFPFMILLDSIASLDNETNETFGNNTAATLLSFFAVFALNSAEVNYKIESAANATKGLMAKTLKWPGFVVEMTKSVFWGMAATMGNPWALIPATVLGALSFAGSLRNDFAHPTTRVTNGLKWVAEANVALFTSAMLLPLIPSANVWSIPSRMGVTAVGSLPLIAVQRVAALRRVRRQPTLELALGLFQGMLLSANTYLSAKNFSQPFKVNLPTPIAYAFLALPLLALGARLLVAAVQKKLSRTDSSSLLKELAQFKYFYKTLAFVAGVGILFNDSANTPTTGMLPMLAGLVLSSLLLYRSLELGRGTFFGVETRSCSSCFFSNSGSGGGVLHDVADVSYHSDDGVLQLPSL